MGREFRYDLAEVLNKDEERVGFLNRQDGDIEIEIKRFLSFTEQTVYYYALNLDTGEFFSFRTIDKTKKNKRGRYFTPSDVEDWIVKKKKEGYELELRVWNIEKFDLRRTIGGIPQKVWYENFLGFFETLQSKPVVWYTYDEIWQASFIWIPEDEWPDYWALILWERSNLRFRFGHLISAIWFWALGIIYKVAKQMEKHKGSIAREKPFQIVMEFMEKDDPIKTVQHILEAELKNYGKERYEKEQIDWLSSIVWQKLLEAEKENRPITLDEIRANLEDGEKLFYNPLRGRSTFLR